MSEKGAEIKRLRDALERYKDVQDRRGVYSAGAILDPTELQCVFCGIDILAGVPRCPLCGEATVVRGAALNPPQQKEGE